MPTQFLRSQIFRAPEAIAMTKLYQVNGAVAPHSHDFVEVVLVIDGEGVHRSREGKVVIQRGSLLIVRPGAWHTYYQCHNLHLYNCCFGFELFTQEFAWFREHSRLNYLFQVGPLSQGRHGILDTNVASVAVQRCEPHLQTLCHLEERSSLADRITTVAYLLLFLGELAQSIVTTSHSEPNLHTHPAVLEAVRLLERDTAEAWTMTALSARVNLSSAYLSRLFREQMGVPPMTYLHQQRMEQAANLLLHTSSSIIRVAFDVGFNDQNYFARCFKTYYGLSATRYRQQFSER